MKYRIAWRDKSFITTMHGPWYTDRNKVQDLVSSLNIQSTTRIHWIEQSQ
jgi:hypothetical protein